MKNIKKYIFAVITLCLCLNLKTAEGAKENTPIVTIDGKEYSIKEAEDVSISMLRSGDRDKQMKAMDFLIRTPVAEQLFQNKKIIDAAIDLYKKVPDISPTYKYGENKDEDANHQLKISLFTMIAMSSDPRGKTILEDVIKSKNEAMCKLGLFFEEQLLERDKALELQKKGGEKQEPTIINPIIKDVSTAKTEDIKVVLSDILANATLRTKIKSIAQLHKQYKYLNTKEGQTKRATILKLLQDHYKMEQNGAVQEEIIGALFGIGGEDARTFIAEVIKDKNTPKYVRKQAEFAIQMLDMEREATQEETSK